MLKTTLTFLVLFMSTAVNLPDGMIARVGLAPDMLKVALTAWIITGLIIHRRLALIILTLALCMGANLPADIAHDYAINRDMVLATLIALVITPIIFRRMR